MPFDQVSHHFTLGPEVALYHKFKDEGMVLDEKEIGRLPKRPVDFLNTKSFKAIREINTEAANTMEIIARSTDDIRDFLLHPTVESLFENNFDLMCAVNESLPEVLYSNQRNIGVYHD